MAFQRYQNKLRDLEVRARRRRLREIAGPQGRILLHQGHEYLNFSSNNYLGLAGEPRLQTAFIKGMEEFGLGSGAARLVNGSMTPFHRLESALARFKGAEASLLFNSGYLANVGALSCLVGEGDVVFSDSFNHASIIDGIRLSRAQKVIFRHNDCRELREKIFSLRRETGDGPTFLIVTESVFSMDGDLCHLGELLDLAEEGDALLYLDEAHATGVFGRTGGGLAEEYRQHPAFESRLIQMGTLGKALGCFGAFIAGPQVLIDFLINQARTFIFTTALPPALASAALASLQWIQEEPERRERLWHNLNFFQEEIRRQLPELHLKVESPIVPILVGPEQNALALSEFFLERGFWVSAIRPPTVPEGTSRLRLTFMATHTEADIRSVVQTLGQGLEGLGINDMRLETGS